MMTGCKKGTLRIGASNDRYVFSLFLIYRNVDTFPALLSYNLLWLVVNLYTCFIHEIIFSRAGHKISSHLHDSSVLLVQKKTLRGLDVAAKLLSWPFWQGAKPASWSFSNMVYQSLHFAVPKLVVYPMLLSSNLMFSTVFSEFSMEFCRFYSLHLI